MTQTSMKPPLSDSVFLTTRGWNSHLVFEQFTKYILGDLKHRLGTVNFIQIGANDGRRGDPINQFVMEGGWSGVLVEPQPEMFKELQKTYRDIEGLTFLNAAISNDADRVKFYAVPQHPALSSLDREVILKSKHRVPDIETKIEEVVVDALPLSKLLDEFFCARPLDAIFIDVEGFDDMVLETLNIKATQPAVIYFEHKLLSREGSAKLRHRLQANHYAMISDAYDCIALHRRSYDAAFVDLFQASVLVASR